MPRSATPVLGKHQRIMRLQLPIILQTTLLLVASRVFMAFAWYAHLKT